MLKGEEIDTFLYITGLNTGCLGSLQGHKFCLAAPSTVLDWAFQCNVWEFILVAFVMFSDSNSKANTVRNEVVLCSYLALIWNF